MSKRYPKLKTSYEKDDPDYDPSASASTANANSDDISSDEDSHDITTISVNSDDSYESVSNDTFAAEEKTEDSHESVPNGTSATQASNGSDESVSHDTSTTENVKTFNSNSQTISDNFSSHSHSDPEDSHEMSLSKEEIEKITKAVCESIVASSSKTSPSPKIDPPKLNMRNYVDWSKKIRSALKFNNLWIDPGKDLTTLTEKEKEINKRAAYYVAVHLDHQNASFVNESNEESFILIWNSIKRFHQPRTATVLTDIYSKLQELKHTSGQPVEEHLMKLEAQFARFTEADHPISEPHQVALILTSVKDSPDFSNVFHSAMWEEDSSLTVAKVKSVLISTSKRSTGDEDHAHVAKFRTNPHQSATTTHTPRVYKFRL